jgi:hypothetical protein
VVDLLVVLDVGVEAGDQREFLFGAPEILAESINSAGFAPRSGDDAAGGRKHSTIGPFQQLSFPHVDDRCQSRTLCMGVT